MRTEADGMLGAIIASESLGLTDTMINGAGGCRSRAQIMMHDLIPRYYPENQGCCRSKYFSRQSRLPCTYMNNDDVVFGPSLKISEGVKSVHSVTGKRSVLLDTLGASLICTDYSGLTGSDDCDPILIGCDLSSLSLAEGYDRTLDAILSSIDISSEPEDSVNVFGYGLMDLGWETGADELCMLLESMRIRVNCIPGCLPSKKDIERIGGSSLNIMIHPEYCQTTCEHLERRFGTPYLRPSMGAPIGYPAIRSFVTEVAEALNKEPTPALEIIDSEAEKVHSTLMNLDRAMMGLHAKGFVIKGDSSTVYPIMRWMMDTLAMAPRKVTVNDDSYAKEITDYLEESGFIDALEGINGRVDLSFTDGMEALEGRLAPSTTGYVEISIPRGRYLDLMGRTLIGPKGCRYILDEMFNTMIVFRCGQPTEVEFRPGYEE